MTLPTKVVGCVYKLENTYLNEYVHSQVLMGIVSSVYTLHVLCATNIDGTVFRPNEHTAFRFRPFTDFLEQILKQNAHFRNLMEQKQVRFDVHEMYLTNHVFNKLNKTKVGRRIINMTAWTRSMIDATSRDLVGRNCMHEDSDWLKNIEFMRKTYIRMNMSKYNAKYRKKYNLPKKNEVHGLIEHVEVGLDRGLTEDEGDVAVNVSEITEISIKVKDAHGNRIPRARISIRVDLGSDTFTHDVMTDLAGYVFVDLQRLVSPVIVHIKVHAGDAYQDKEVMWHIGSNGYRGVIILDYALNETYATEMIETEVIEDA